MISAPRFGYIRPRISRDVYTSDDDTHETAFNRMRPRPSRPFARPHAGLFLAVRASPPHTSRNYRIYILHARAYLEYKTVSLFYCKNRRVARRKMQTVRLEQ